MHRGALATADQPDQESGPAPKRMLLPRLRVETWQVALDAGRRQMGQGAGPRDDPTEHRAEYESPHRGPEMVGLWMAQRLRAQAKRCRGGRTGPMVQAAAEALLLEALEA